MDRAQAHTVEAFVAALLIVSAIGFALQATAVTPLSASTSNQHIENQQRATASDLMATAEEEGHLSEAVLYWNASGGEFHDTGEQPFYTMRLPTELAFGDALADTFTSGRIAYNLHVRYHEPGGGTAERAVVSMGSPSDNAVAATRTVPLYNSTTLTAPGHESRTLAEVESSADESFYAPNVGDGQLYNLVEVRLVVWRM